MTTPIEGKVLGKQVTYPQTYQPDILVAVPRHLNREQYDLATPPKIYVGYDTWHAYELSFLTQKGLPVTGLLKIVYPATTPSLVESKSLKLYLNSFNMSRFGNTPQEGIKEVLHLIENDLTNLLEGQVSLELFRGNTDTEPLFEDFQILEELPEAESLSISQYEEDPALLIPGESKGTLKVSTHLLRSNCKITHQPDWGSAFIHIKADSLPDKISLLKYLVSLRNENHFHEEICEMVYKRLWDLFKPEELMVCCLYTRRGGIDICPVRANHTELLPKALIDHKVLSSKLLRQ